MTAFLKWRVFQFWFALIALAGLACCFAPILAVLGYEHSLIVSVICAIGSGHIAALVPSRLRQQRGAFSGGASNLLATAVLPGLALPLLPLVLSLINSIWVPQCNLGVGIAFYLLLPVISVVLAAVTGLLCGLVTRSGRAASALWFFVFFSTLCASAYEFYATPPVFSFGPFYGYFPGVLYDELVSVEPRLLSYRALGVVQIAAIAALVCAALETESMRLSWRVLLQKRRCAWLAAALVAVAMAGVRLGEQLGHRTSRRHLERQLPVRMAVPGLDLFFPPHTDPSLALELTQDARFSLDTLCRDLGVQPKQRIAVFFFASASDKARAMGASGTNVAKPWRSEVYVLQDNAPHPVLRHELAHVVAAELAPGPFHVPGRLLGLIPNPGLIEGLAVANQGPRSDLLPHQWAAAMKRLKLLPPLSQIFGLRFLGYSASTAYTAAGSFCLWLQERYGKAALSAVYGGADWKSATSEELADLEKSWLAYLGGVQLSEADLAAAEHRFDRPAVVHKTCVHEVARLEAAAQNAQESGDFDTAIEIADLAYRRSGGAAPAALERFFARVDAGRTDEARVVSQQLLASAALSSVAKARVMEVLADLDVQHGEGQRAARLYEELAAKAPSSDALRKLLVKARLAQSAAPSARLVTAALAERPDFRKVPEPLAMLAMAELADELPADPFAAYLVGRQHYRFRDYATALRWLDKSRALGLDDPRDPIAAAAALLQGEALFRLKRFDEAMAVYRGLAKNSALRLGLRAEAQDWYERALFHSRQIEK